MKGPSLLVLKTRNVRRKWKSIDFQLHINFTSDLWKEVEIEIENRHNWLLYNDLIRNNQSKVPPIATDNTLQPLRASLDGIGLWLDVIKCKRWWFFCCLADGLDKYQLSLFKGFIYDYFYTFWINPDTYTNYLIFKNFVIWVLKVEYLSHF